MYGEPPRFNHGPPPPPPPQFNPIFPPNPNFLPPHLNQFLPNPSFPANFPFQNPNFPFQNPNFPPDGPLVNPNEVLEMVDRAVEKARGDLVAAGDSVSTWKVRQAALVILKTDSWDSFGFQMQEVPSLYRLMVTEGKINAFIHCFVGVRKITSLYDLELAICKIEGIEKFEELELGPLLRHPLVVQYFGASPDVRDVFKITSEEIISFISKLIRKKKQKDITVDELLDFIAKKKSVDKKELLSVRIRSLVMHISYIQQGWNSEQAAINKYLGDENMTSGKKSRKLLGSSYKKQLDEHIGVMSEPVCLGDENTTSVKERRKRSVSSPQIDEHVGVSSLTSIHKDIHGKHIRFTSSGSENMSNTLNNDKDDKDGTAPQNPCSYPSPIARFDRSSCPYPSLDEEIKRLRSKGKVGPSPSPATSTLLHNGHNRPLKRKRISEGSSTRNPAHQFLKRDEDEARGLNNNKQQTLSAEKKKQINEVDVARDIDSLRKFISIWKEACMENNVTQVLDMMIEFYETREGKKVKELFMHKPFAELLNVAVEAIKGISDSMHGTPQASNHPGGPNPHSINIIDQLSLGMVEDKVLTGRIGEFVAFNYFSGKFGGTCVRWINETHETGFPYDIAVGDEEIGREYIEVKATKSDKKDWFNITAKEWQFAVEKGECYSIARVTLQSNDMAKVTIYKNPARLCQLGQLQLAMLIPRQQHNKEIAVAL
ncbi:protein NO VEIN-LIKE isoform X2 [Apium graveolens]|uniref:protein NO VEIN-LIKE isoform X2 n=1 Tax=Apium graveolens TaxID=4045 RepID=UPI003D7B16F4